MRVTDEDLPEPRQRACKTRGPSEEASYKAAVDNLVAAEEHDPEFDLHAEQVENYEVKSQR